MGGRAGSVTNAEPRIQVLDTVGSPGDGASPETCYTLAVMSGASIGLDHRNSYRMPANMETAGEYMTRTLPEIKATLQGAVNAVITRRSDNPLVEIAHEIMHGEQGNMGKLQQTRVRAMADNGSLFDAHLHYLNFKQKTEGIETLLKCMDAAGIGMAALTGCPLKKSWVGTDMKEGPPEHALYDDGDLYFYSLTDALVAEDMEKADVLVGSKAVSRLCMLACGFNLGALHPLPYCHVPLTAWRCCTVACTERGLDTLGT